MSISFTPRLYSYPFMIVTYPIEHHMEDRVICSSNCETCERSSSSTRRYLGSDKKSRSRETPDCESLYSGIC